VAVTAADGAKLSLIGRDIVNQSDLAGLFIYPRFIDNDAYLLLVMLRCLRFNPVNTFEDFEHYAKQPARSLVAEIHKGCIKNKKRPQFTNQNLGD
jgi:hypothetical protein